MTINIKKIRFYIMITGFVTMIIGFGLPPTLFDANIIAAEFVLMLFRLIGFSVTLLGILFLLLPNTLTYDLNK